jgi:hypothetical protein
MATQTFYTAGDKKLTAGASTSAIVNEFELERTALESAFQGVRDELDGGVAPDATAALLPGRAGSQILNGGTAAGEDLALQSTSDATKGNVDVGVDDSTVQLGGSGSSIGVLGTAGIPKAAAIPALVDGTGGTSTGALVPMTAVGGSGATTGQEGEINDNFARLAATQEAIRSTMSAYGWY